MSLRSLKGCVNLNHRRPKQPATTNEFLIHYTLFKTCQPVVGKYIKVLFINDSISRQADVTIRIVSSLAISKQPSQCKDGIIFEIDVASAGKVAYVNPRKLIRPHINRCGSITIAVSAPGSGMD